MNIRFRKHFFQAPFEDVNSTGGADIGSTSEPISAPAPAEPSPAPAASAPAPAPSMLDAINAHFESQQQPAPGQPRDELGRFAPKNPDGSLMTAEQQAAAGIAPPVAGTQPGQKPAAEQPGAKPETAEDLTLMPEGLQPKARERFQALANTNKELTSQNEQLRTQVDYVRETFQQHGIQQPQFEQAAAVIGMMNRGDLPGALAVLDEQRRMISLAMGQPLPGVDALSEFPDLRSAVDNMQVTEQHAMEIARSRHLQLTQQRQNQQAQQQHQVQQANQQAVHQGTLAVDRLCQQLASSDMDYATIEAQLLPVIPKLLQGVPPNQWENAVRTQYDLLKQVASRVRSSAPTTTQPLRPTGHGSPATAPTSMFDAMWGNR